MIYFPLKPKNKERWMLVLIYMLLLNSILFSLTRTCALRALLIALVTTLLRLTACSQPCMRVLLYQAFAFILCIWLVGFMLIPCKVVGFPSIITSFTCDRFDCVLRHCVPYPHCLVLHLNMLFCKVFILLAGGLLNTYLSAD